MTTGDFGRLLQRGLRFLVTVPILLYRYLISPLFPQTCIYHPSCSSYAQDAIMKHGPLRGLALAVPRVFRCSSMFTGGYDPVPTEFSFELIREGYREFREPRRRPGLLQRIRTQRRHSQRRDGG